MGKKIAVLALGLALTTVAAQAMNESTVAAQAMNESGVAPAASENGADAGTCEPPAIKTNEPESCLLQDKMVKVSSDATLNPGGNVVLTNLDEVLSNPNALIVNGAILETAFNGQPASYWFDSQIEGNDFLIADSAVQFHFPIDVNSVEIGVRVTDQDMGTEVKALLYDSHNALIGSLDEKSVGFLSASTTFLSVHFDMPFRSVVFVVPGSPWLIGTVAYRPSM